MEDSGPGVRTGIPAVCAPRAAPAPAEPRRRPVLSFPEGDVVVVSGLPGSGKSTLIRRTVPEGVQRVDSQNVRDRWAAGPAGRWLPYAVYRPLVRVSHYRGLLRALRGGHSLVVHDCGVLPWVRWGIERSVRRSGRGMHLVLLDVDPETALDGQTARGRRVSRYAFARHRRATGRLRAAVARGGTGYPAVVLDRAGADAVRRFRFGSLD
ncbi:AAA family ATPase [Streptomyces sp. NPDC051940]|uniref:AAA family ATPase n=1 Tax=Streptomyces sp. NPDC051940 TaxID=3155675 RepID=UPI0034408C8C